MPKGGLATGARVTSMATGAKLTCTVPRSSTGAGLSALVPQPPNSKTSAKPLTTALSLGVSAYI